MLGVTNDMRAAAYAAVTKVVSGKTPEEADQLFLLVRELADAALDAAGQVVLDQHLREQEEARVAALNKRL